MLFNKLLTKRQDHDFTNHPCANSNTHGHMIHREPNTSTGKVDQGVTVSEGLLVT